MTGPDKSRAPRAFKVSAEDETPPPRARTAEPARVPRAVKVKDSLAFEPDDFFEQETLGELESEALATPPPPRRWPGAGAIAMAALGVILSLSFGLWADALVRDLMARTPWLGQAALAVLAVLVLAVVVLVARELLALRRLASVAALQARIATARAANNDRQIAEATAALERHLAGHPKTAAGRARLAGTRTMVIDAADRLDLVERELLAGLDREARAMVLGAARRVSVVTAVSPRALVDIGYVLFENVRLIRRMAEHYGGRTGALGTLALTRRVVAHLAVTGTLALGDSLIQQFLGHGLAARLSARLGEGVVNGLMTARVGLAAMDVCRPAPFAALPRPRLSEMAGRLVSLNADKAAGGDEKAA